MLRHYLHRLRLSVLCSFLDAAAVSRYGLMKLCAWRLESYRLQKVPFWCARLRMPLAKRGGNASCIFDVRYRPLIKYLGIAVYRKYEIYKCIARKLVYNIIFVFSLFISNKEFRILLIPLLFALFGPRFIYIKMGI